MKPLPESKKNGRKIATRIATAATIVLSSNGPTLRGSLRPRGFVAMRGFGAHPASLVSSPSRPCGRNTRISTR